MGSLDRLDRLDRQGRRAVREFADELDSLANAFRNEPGTPDALRDLSSRAANVGARFYRVAGDAQAAAERLDPTPIGFKVPESVTAPRDRLHVVDGMQGDS